MSDIVASIGDFNPHLNEESGNGHEKPEVTLGLNELPWSNHVKKSK